MTTKSDSTSLQHSRPWDPENRHQTLEIKSFKYWSLELSGRQHTPGCCIVFCKRNLVRFSELLPKELIEFQKIILRLEKAWATTPSLKPEITNCLQMGNSLRWLHVHLIPRYASKRIVAGKNWVDKNFGHPVKWSYKTPSEKTLEQIKSLIKEKI